ncbi:LOW QUALITY PROTEIN: tyrosine-protein kinase BAZ1B-like [Glandiceps talaboti]
MPLLGRRNHALAKPLKDKKDDESIYVIDFTKEEFRSKEEYRRRLEMYSDSVWTCQCTGRTELTYQEALQSEKRAHRQLQEHFPVYFEKPVLEIVHHNTIPLDSLVDKSHQNINAIFAEGEPVELTVKISGKVLKGKIVKAHKMSDDEMPSNCSSPSSDKENTEGSSSAVSPKKEQINKHLYKYLVQLSVESKLLSSVPAADLKRVNRTPNKDLIKLFIRAHAVRAGTNPNSPWIVEDVLVKKYSLPSKFAELLLAPKKVSPDGGLGKRKSLSAATAKPAKKAKISDTKTKDKSDKKTANKSDSLKDLAKKKKSPKLLSTSVKKSSSPGKSPNRTTSPKKQTSKIKTIVVSSSSSSDSDSESESDSDLESKPLIFFKRKIEEQKLKSGQSSNSSSPKKSSGSSKNSTPRSSPSKKSSNKKDVKKNLKQLSLKEKKKKEKDGNKNKNKDKKKVKDKKDKVKNLKAPRKGTPKNSPKKSPKKTPSKTGKNKIQVTLFDIAKKKGLKVEKKGLLSPPKSPRSPRSPRQPLIAKKLEKARRENNKTQYQHLVSRAVRELNMQRVHAIRDPDIRGDVQKKLEAKLERIKWKMMSPEERKKAIEQKREERKEHAKKERQKKLEEERKMRKEKAQRYEDQELSLKPLPIPKLVQLPEGLPNTLFGDIAMVTEFISCYADLLMPDDPYPITAECLMKALVSGNEGFGYLSRVLVILLQTLLQDGIAEDYRELDAAVSDIPVNCILHLMHTASELVRLCLRPHDDEVNRDDDNDDDDSDDEMTEDHDVEPMLIDKLESSEFIDLEPGDKLQILVGLCHRIMSSFSVQDYMEEKQRNATQLWRQKKEKEKEVKKKKKEERDAVKQKKGEEDKSQKENTEKEEEKDENKKEKKEKKAPPPPAPVKKEEEEEDLPPDDETDLASIVKRRRILAAREKTAKQEREKLDKERRIKEQEEYKKQKFEQQQSKAFEEGTIAAKMSLRQMPVGTDRNHSRYWTFSHVVPGLFVEKGWMDTNIEYHVPKSDNMKKEDNGSRDSGDSEIDSDTDTLSSLLNQMEKNKEIEKSVPKTGQNLWFQYDSMKDLDRLLDVLNNQGIRESTLLSELKERYQDIVKSINLSKRPFPGLRDSDGKQELLDNFKQDLLDTETRLRKGGLGGVDNYDKWEKKLINATKVKEMGPLLVETQSNVLPKFLKGIMSPPKPKKKPEPGDVPDQPVDEDDNDDNNDDEDEDEDRMEQEEAEEEDKAVSKSVLKWQEAIQDCPTMSRLHVLLGIMDSCIKWEKSAENAKCKICRKKGNEDKLLLCDECNQPFHLYCLRPALSSVPKGDWMCPACKPSMARKNSRGRDYAQLDGYSDSESDEYMDEQSELEHDEICCICEEDQELVLCTKCPSAYHRECHDPPLRNFPRGKWVCSSCLNYRSSRARSKRKRAPIKKKKSLPSKKSKSGKSSKKSSPASAGSSGDSTSYSTSRKRSADGDMDDWVKKSSSRPQRGNSDLKSGEDLLNKLIRHKSSWPFRRPVELDEAPDYYDIISDPMDFQTMKNKCLCLDYKTVDDFIDDIKLIFNNAEIYNRVGSEVLDCKEQLEEYFVELMEKQLTDLVYKRDGPYIMQQQSTSNAREHDDHSYVSKNKRKKLEK